MWVQGATSYKLVTGEKLRDARDDEDQCQEAYDAALKKVPPTDGDLVDFGGTVHGALLSQNSSTVT